MQEGDHVTLQRIESESAVHNLNGRKGTITGRKGDRYIVFLDTGVVSVLKTTLLPSGLTIPQTAHRSQSEISCPRSGLFKKSRRKWFYTQTQSSSTWLANQGLAGRLRGMPPVPHAYDFVLTGA